MTDRKIAWDLIRIRAAVLAAVFIFAAAIAVSPSYAADDTKAIELVNNGTAAGIAGKQKSNIYFGNYKQSSDGKGGFRTEPVKWRVLQNADGRLFLMSDQLLDTILFHRIGGSVWSTIDARSWLNGYGEFSGNSFINEAFSEKEQTSIAKTLLNNKDDNPKYNIPNGDDTEDKIFILSYSEATDTNLGFNSDHEVEDSARAGTFTDYAASIERASEENLWLLRTKGIDDRRQAAVHGKGDISLSGSAVNQHDGGGYPKPIRPALKVDLGSVLFTSSAVNGKQSDGIGSDALKAVDDHTGKDWKLTLEDPDREFGVTETEASCRANEKITLNYTGAEAFDTVSAPNEFISAMIVGRTGKALYYGRVAQPTSSDGKVDIRIPITLEKGIYDLKVFSEQFNGDRKTDFASEMSTVKLTVDDPLVPYVNDAGRKQEPKISRLVTDNMELLSSEVSGWYVVARDTVMDKTIVINGDVNLILCDKTTFNTRYGIAINAGSSLTIWAQSMGDSVGRITADLAAGGTTDNVGRAGIGFKAGGQTGKLTINGGRITAKGFMGGAGIGGNSVQAGGDVTINGGTVIVRGSSSGLDNAQAIGYGAKGLISGDLTLRKVRVSSNGGSLFVASGDRKDTCRSKDDEILIERCTPHIFNGQRCQACGTGRPTDISGAEVTLGDKLTYNGETQTQTVTKITLNGEDITECCNVTGNTQKDAGEHELTVTGDRECDYDGTVKKKFTIRKATPGFTVACDDVKDDLNVSAAVFRRSDETIPGTVALTETSLAYGTNMYNWMFTPEDTKNYENLSGTVQITVTGHKWKFDGFEWIGSERDGYTSAKAKYVCENNKDHKETVSEVTIESIVIEPTISERGRTVYTAKVMKEDSLDDEEHTGNIEAKITGKLDPNDITPSDDHADDAKEDRNLPVIDIDKTDTVGNYKKRQMKIVFPANRKVDNYRIQYRLAGKKKWTDGWSAGTGTYIVGGLKKYSLCEFRIAGYVKLNDGTWIRSRWSKISYRYVNSVPLKKVKAAKKKITVTYKKDSRSDGYRIQYSLKKNMAGRKSVTVKGKSRTKYTVKGLKKGKTYFIKVRPIKKKYGRIYIGILSGKKKVKVK